MTVLENIAFPLKMRGVDRAEHEKGARAPRSTPSASAAWKIAALLSSPKGSGSCVVLRHGAYFHPRQNMFLSCAHLEADIERTLEAAKARFRAVRHG